MFNKLCRDGPKACEVLGASVLQANIPYGAVCCPPLPWHQGLQVARVTLSNHYWRLDAGTHLQASAAAAAALRARSGKHTRCMALCLPVLRGGTSR
jgi:hypothetical protein